MIRRFAAVSALAVVAIGAAGCADVIGIESVTRQEEVPVEAKSIDFYYFFSRPIAEDFTLPAFLVIDDNELAGFVAFAGGEGAEADPTRGHFSAHSVDCTRRDFVGGVSYSSNKVPTTPGTAGAGATGDSAFYWYMDMGAPVTSRSSTEAPAPSLALGGIFNHPTGVADVTSTLEASGETIATSRIFVQPGALSTMTIVPNADEALTSPPDGDWSCLPTMAASPTAATATITYNVSYLNPAPDKTLEGLRFRACNSPGVRDLQCQNVDAEVIVSASDLSTDADGNVDGNAATVTVDLPLANGPWSGYILIDDPAAK